MAARSFSRKTGSKKTKKNLVTARCEREICITQSIFSVLRRRPLESHFGGVLSQRSGRGTRHCCFGFGAAAKHGHPRQSVGARFPAFGGALRRPRAPPGHVGGAHPSRIPGGGRRVPAGGRSSPGRLQSLRKPRRRTRLQD